MWTFHAILLSICSPKYLATFALGISVLFRYTCGQSERLKAQITWVLLVSLTFILQSCSHVCIRFKCSCTLAAAICGSQCLLIVTVSSVNVPMWAVGVIGMSAVCNKYSRDATLRNCRVYVVDGRICLTVFNLKVSVRKVGLRDQVIFTWKILFNLVQKPPVPDLIESLFYVQRSRSAFDSESGTPYKGLYQQSTSRYSNRNK